MRHNPPHFTEQPQSMIIHANTSKILSCAVNIQNIISGYNTIEMYWEFDGKKIENPEMLSDVTIPQVEHGRLQLKFQHFNETNTGRYRCVMQDGLFSIVSEVAELTLYGKEYIKTYLGSVYVYTVNVCKLGFETLV